ncbi:hypothetical protein [Leptospira alstonii]|uniref:Uncharacterized protein n=2 Tax=Leptospira alstonii TaxID=28452 RepID=M6CYC6_9LEPT|nr:hypothetical protein [Leptospira alstonii]EMJ96699.1 hypothetical protein LEP1GSC194_4298 [Leptospira alstonii serovar Sichuan str. 79601]EQA78734.1 hypothetical protein LEP1GSC193_1684 [Leptospira alstonii serovar Pingchang str. 80-412]
MNNEIESVTIVLKDRTVIVLDVASMRIISPGMVEKIQTAIENSGVDKTTIQDNIPSG